MTRTHTFATVTLLAAFVVAGMLIADTITGWQDITQIGVPPNPSTGCVNGSPCARLWVGVHGAVSGADILNCNLPNGASCMPATSHGLVFAIGAPASGVVLTTSSVSSTLIVPFGCTIGSPSGAKYSIALGSGDSGTVTVKFWKIAGGTAIPTVANVINTSGLSLISGMAVQSSVFTDFTTTSVSANDMMVMSLASVTGTIDSVLVVLPCAL